MDSTTDTMIDKGREYVERWPDNIARPHRIGSAYVVEAINTVTGSDLPSHLPAGDDTFDLVATFTPDTAKAVVAEVKNIAARLDHNRRTQCHYCGQPLRGGRCEECRS